MWPVILFVNINYSIGNIGTAAVVHSSLVADRARETRLNKIKIVITLYYVNVHNKTG